MSDSYLYDFFVSHSSEDKQRVTPLVDHLRRAGFKLWFDEDVVRFGLSLADAISHGVKNSRRLLLFLSPTALQSRWIGLELKLFQQRDPDNSDHTILPVKLALCDAPHKISFIYALPLTSDFERNKNTLLTHCGGAQAPSVSPAVQIPTTQSLATQRVKAKAPSATPTVWSRAAQSPATQIPAEHRVWPDWASDRWTDGYGNWVAFTYQGLRQTLRWIPPGRFLMGSPEDELRRLKDEGPQVEISFDQGFWMFDTAVNQALYHAVIGSNPSHFQGPNLPVEQVSWHDAQTFMARLNAAVPGLALGLPSEAQWEYACRAGSTTPFEPTVAHTYGGATATPEEVNYDGNTPYGAAKEGLYREKTVPVSGGGFRPNSWGLWHMQGNVWEWCADGWSDSHEGADPQGVARPVAAGGGRVVRGGSWRYYADNCRAAYRHSVAPVYRSNLLGFRCACGPLVTPA